jgi:hypothetical protein
VIVAGSSRKRTEGEIRGEGARVGRGGSYGGSGEERTQWPAIVCRRCDGEPVAKRRGPVWINARGAAGVDRGSREVEGWRSEGSQGAADGGESRGSQKRNAVVRFGLLAAGLGLGDFAKQNCD